MAYILCYRVVLCIGKKTIKKRKIIIEKLAYYINTLYIYSVIKKQTK